MSKKARVLFVYPNERQMSTIPPAIALLSQLLKQDGHITGIFDTTFYEFEDDIKLEDGDNLTLAGGYRVVWIEGNVSDGHRAMVPVTPGNWVAGFFWTGTTPCFSRRR